MSDSDKMTVGILAFLMVAVLTVWLFATSEFKEQCAKSGGQAVWDGRQYQCIKP